jgi:hypothetical protein
VKLIEIKDTDSEASNRIVINVSSNKKSKRSPSPNHSTKSKQKENNTEHRQVSPSAFSIASICKSERKTRSMSGRKQKKSITEE